MNFKSKAISLIQAFWELISPSPSVSLMNLVARERSCKRTQMTVTGVTGM
jgi:hypothetical protein